MIIEKAIQGPFQVGTVMKAWQLGYAGREKMIVVACPRCTKTRWVSYRRPSRQCTSCHGKTSIRKVHVSLSRPRPEISIRQLGAKNHMWRGGRRLGSYGYYYVRIFPDHPYADMANRLGYAMEHRIVMAEHLGRSLHKWERVHHINGARGDNRIENLELWKHASPSGVRQADYHCAGCQCNKETR